MIAVVALALAEPSPEEAPSLSVPTVRPPPAPRLTTAGFRTFLPAGNRVETRLAFVQDFDGASIGEVTVRAQLGWPAGSVGVELAGTAAGSELWSGAGIGNLVVDGRLLVGGPSTHAFGLRGTLGVGDRSGPRGPVEWWGTVPAATIPTWGAALVYEGATDRWVWAFRTGLKRDTWMLETLGVLDLAASVARIQPIVGPISAVVELELLNAPSPWHVRALARVAARGWSADLGLAVPIPGMFQDPSLQVLGAVRREW